MIKLLIWKIPDKNWLRYVSTNINNIASLSSYPVNSTITLFPLFLITQLISHHLYSLKFFIWKWLDHLPSFSPLRLPNSPLEDNFEHSDFVRSDFESNHLEQSTSPTSEENMSNRASPKRKREQHGDMTPRSNQFAPFDDGSVLWWTGDRCD